MRMTFEQFNSQFRETDDEVAERWRATKAKRRAEGKCWQCAKPVADCRCPNVTHSSRTIEDKP